MSAGDASCDPDTSYGRYNPAAAAAAQWPVPMRAACRQGRNDAQGSLVGAPPAMVRMSAHQLLVTVPVECLGVRHPAAILHVTSFLCSMGRGEAQYPGACKQCAACPHLLQIVMS